MKNHTTFTHHQRDSAHRQDIGDETIHDPYQPKGKPSQPMVCSTCEAVFHNGRWQWSPPPAEAHHMQCPACRRIHEKFPAGYLTIEGDYAREHRSQLLRAARNHEAQEKVEHPMQRIMNIEESHDRVLITTTDIHLARGIGEALHHANGGDIKFRYEKGEYLLRVNWTR